MKENISNIKSRDALSENNKSIGEIMKMYRIKKIIFF